MLLPILEALELPRSGPPAHVTAPAPATLPTAGPPAHVPAGPPAHVLPEA